MTIHYEKFGAGPTLVLIHGLFGTLDNLKTLAKKLSTDFEVFLIDAPAHGQSTTPKPLTIECMAEQVIEFLLEQNLSDVSFIGHSLGGKVSMEIALRAPQLVKQIIVADIAPVKYHRRHDAILKGLNSVGPDTKDRREADAKLKPYIEEVGVRGFLLKSFVNKNDKLWAFDLNAITASYDNLIEGNLRAQSQVRTLFIIGGKSDYVKSEYRSDVVYRFPNSSYQVIANAGHWLHAEQPAKFEKICRDFLVVS